jgi:transposase
MDLEEIIKQQGNQIQTLEAQIGSYQSELNTYQKRCEQYAEAYDHLQHQLKELLRNRFGKKSERFIDPEHPQFSLLEKNADLFTSAEASGDLITEAEIKVAAYSRKNNNKSDKELPHRVEIIPLNKEDMICSCGACKKVISYEKKDLIHYQTAVFEIIEQRREVAICPKGCDGEMVTAPAPLHILPKIKATEELLSFLVVSKLDDRQPLYHLEKQLSERHGVDCSRQTMARWMIELMFPLQPLWNLMKDQVIEYDVAACDATTLQVLREPGRAAETKSYVYCMRGGPPEKSVILYEYNEKEHKKFVFDWFQGFTGYLHADGDNFFDLVGEIIAQMVNCNSHARRKFEPIAQGAKGKGLAKEAMRFFKELYKIEREAKNKKLTPEQRYQLRQEKSKPLMEKFKAWLDEMYPTVLPQSALGKAMFYCINLWPGLTRFLDDGRLEIDNNLTEQEIKPLVIARKNFMFCTSVDGAKALCMHFSFVRTAKLHGLDPYHYYVKVLKSIPHCNSVDDYEKLLPWNIQLDYVKKID